MIKTKIPSGIDEVTISVHLRVPEQFAAPDDDDEFHLTGMDIRVLRQFISRSMIGEDRTGLNNGIAALYSLATRAVSEQAYESGYLQGLTTESPLVSKAADPLWRDSYNEGFGVGRSARDGHPGS